MSDDGEVVHKLLIGEQPFAIIADAIRILSVERLKFQRLKDVIVEAVNSRPKPTREQLELFAAQLPLDGRVQIYLRLSRTLNSKLDGIKTDLSERLGDNCGVRETVVFCALAISQR